MEVEQLNLENFDINTFEPPNFKISDSFEPIDSDEDINLELYDDEEEDIEISIDENDMDFEDEFDNVIYSYPFYSKDGIDYEYRVTISDEELLLEQVKCDDSKPDFEESIQVFAEIYRGPLNETFEFITKFVDLRDKKLVLQEGIIDYNFENLNGNVEILKNKIENNKVSVLFELYKEIIDSVYE
jgi:hypothetical protein